MIVTIKREHLFDNTGERDRRREKKEYVPLYYITPPLPLSLSLCRSLSVMQSFVVCGA